MRRPVKMQAGNRTPLHKRCYPAGGNLRRFAVAFKSERNQ